MREREEEKAAHLLILVVYTVFALILAGEAYLMKWEAGPVLLLFLVIIACWAIYVLEKVPISIQLWLDVIGTPSKHPRPGWVGSPRRWTGSVPHS